MKIAMSNFHGSSIRVFKLAVLSRILLLGLALLWRILGRPYDTSALLNTPCLSTVPSPSPPVNSLQEMPGIGGWLGRQLETSVVWDGVYYIRIAQCGYEYEQNFAFLPVIPLSIRLIGNIVLPRLIPVVGYRATLALSGYLLNNIAFILSAIFFYKVSITVLDDEKLAFRATALFCFNPASVFYGSLYSESLFSFLSFAGLWELLSGSSWRAACLFGFSSGTRSNGLIHAGFLLFQAMQEAYTRLFYKRRLMMAVQIVGVVALQTAVVVIPFVAFQIYGFSELCHRTKENGSHISRPWCYSKIPYLYGFVQSHYWNVGFMRYFEVKQLPNFLLALPMLSLAAFSIAAYIKHKPMAFLSLGLCTTQAISPALSSDSNFAGTHIHERRNQLDLNRRPIGILTGTSHLQQRRGLSNSETDRSHTEDKHDKLTNVNQSSFSKGGFFSPLNIPFLLEMAFMAMVAFFIMYVQVATRFLSVCPPIYWFAAHKMNSSPSGHLIGYLVWAIFFIYVSLGSLLFVNFYPFT